MGMTFEFGVIDDSTTHNNKLQHCKANHVNLNELSFRYHTYKAYEGIILIKLYFSASLSVSVISSASVTLSTAFLIGLVTCFHPRRTFQEKKK